MELLIALAIVLCVAAFISVPLRRPRGGEDAGDATSARAELEARKEAKYREIREAELDRAAGKLSAEDHARLEAELRAEAAEILRRLDRLEKPDRAG